MLCAAFNATVSNAALPTALAQVRNQAARQRKVDATPCLVFAGPGGETSNESGEKGYHRFAASVAKVAG